MPSQRERAVTALYDYLNTTLSDITVLRNAVLPTSIPATGLIIVRDGEVGEPEIVLSPTRYIYKHRAECDVITQHPEDAQREQQLDELLVTLGRTLQQANTLGGIIDLLTVSSPEITTEPIEGAATIKAATVPVILEYVTNNPLL